MAPLIRMGQMSSTDGDTCPGLPFREGRRRSTQQGAFRPSHQGSGRARSINEAPGSFDAPARPGRKHFEASRCL